MHVLLIVTVCMEMILSLQQVELHLPSPDMTGQFFRSCLSAKAAVFCQRVKTSENNPVEAATVYSRKLNQSQIYWLTFEKNNFLEAGAIHPPTHTHAHLSINAHGDTFLTQYIY